MTRTRLLRLVLLAGGGFVVLLFGWSGVQNLLDNLDEKDRQGDKLRGEIMAQRERLFTLSQAKSKVNIWKTISLPPDPAVSSPLYRQFLQDLCWRHEMEVKQMTEGGSRASSPRAISMVTPLSFQVQVETTLPRLLLFLKSFYLVHLPHQIREISIAPRGSGVRARLEVSFQVEVLVLPNAEPRDSLLPVPDSRVILLEALTALKQGPTGLALAAWVLTPTGPHGGRKLAAQHAPGRDYASLEAKNVFAGLALPSGSPSMAGARLDFVQLTSIISNTTTIEASLRNHQTNTPIRLKAQPGFDAFEIRGSKGQLFLEGKVKAISQRKLLFMEGEFYAILRVGQLLSDREKKLVLSTADLQEFGLIPMTAAARKPPGPTP